MVYYKDKFVFTIIESHDSQLNQYADHIYLPK